MHVLFLTHYFHPEVGAPQSRILELAYELSDRAHEITVLTGFPNYPDGVIQAPYRGRRLMTERLGDLRVVRTAIYPAPNRGVGRRLLNHLSFALSSLPASAKTGPADVIVVESPPLFAAVAGVAIGALKRAPVVLNVADLWPDAAIQFGAVRRRRVIAAARALERFAYRHADLIAVPTPGLERVLRERGHAAERIVVIPHGVDPGRFVLTGHERAAGRRVVYAGTIGMGHAVGTLIHAARQLEERGAGCEFVIAGDGAERAELEALAHDLALRSVTFAGRLPRSELPALLASADVTVATQRDLPLLADALSTKVLEYMAASRPVVAAAAGWTAEVIAAAGAGIACPPEQPGALADAIAQIVDDPERARAMGASGRSYVEAHLTRGAAADTLDRALRSLVDDGGR